MIIWPKNASHLIQHCCQKNPEFIGDFKSFGRVAKNTAKAWEGREILHKARKDKKIAKFLLFYSGNFFLGSFAAF